MKKCVFFRIFIILIASLSSFSCKKNNDNSLQELKERGVFVLGFDDSFAPMGFKDENNEIQGFDIELAKEVCNRLGVEFKAQKINWSSKEIELLKGNIDCIWNGFTVTEERKKSFCLTKSYLNNNQVLVVRSDSNINSLKDFAGKTVGLQENSTALDAIKENPEFEKTLKNLVFYSDNITALNDLEVGGIDGIVMDSIVAFYDIKLTNRPLTLLDEILAKEEYAVAFRKQDEKLCNEVQRILEEMKKDGTIESISTNWFGSDITIF